MNPENLKEAIRRELPALLRTDPELREYIIDVSRRTFADGEETRDRFWEVLGGLRRDREAQEKKWADQEKKWEAQERKWEDQAKRWEDQERKWDTWRKKSDEQDERWEEQDKRWEEQDKWWEENVRQWRENNEHFKRVHNEIMAQARRHDRTIGARWGVKSERSFRNALSGILKDHFDVQVIHVNEYDDEGVVFGHPDQVELDVIIRDGLLIIGELKSSMSKSDIYIFERKARFYERRHGRKADRLIVISPMIEPRAEETAAALGIEVFSDAEDVESI